MVSMPSSAPGEVSSRLLAAVAGATGLAIATAVCLAPARVPETVPTRLPPTVADGQNAFLAYREALRLAPALSPASYALIEDAVTRKPHLDPGLERYAGGREAALALLATGARRPAIAIPLDASFRAASRLTLEALLDARLALEAGRTRAGLSRLLDVLAFGRGLAYAPHADLHALLNGQSVTETALATLAVAPDDWLQVPDAELERFAAGLESLDRVEAPPHNMLWGERDRALDALRQGAPEVTQHHNRDPIAALCDVVDAHYAREAVPVAARVFARRMALLDRRDLAALERDPGAGTFVDDDKGALYGVVHLLFNFGTESTNLMADLESPRVAGATARMFALEAAFDGVRLQVALERYRRKHGQLPARLDSLVPAYLAAIPADPFLPSRPLSYRGGRAWSVGQDCTDQGGRPALAWYASKRDLLVNAGDLVVVPLPALRPQAEAAPGRPPAPSAMRRHAASGASAAPTMLDTFSRGFPELATLFGIGEDPQPTPSAPPPRRD